LIDMSRQRDEEGIVCMDKVELLMVGTVSKNLELNLLGILELGTVSSWGDGRLFLDTGGNSDSSSSTSEEEEGEGLAAILKGRYYNINKY